MDVSESISSSGTTTMLNNDLIVAAKFHTPADIPHSLLENAGTGYDQDIKAFLAKPVLLSSGVFSAVTVAGIIDDWILPNALFNKEVYRRKLQGYLGVRGKIILRIQLNATKFQQGRLILCYNPMSSAQDFARLDSPMLVTQLPHVQIDIATQTEAILEIPFVSNYTHFGLISGEGPWAHAYLYRYLPFRTGAGSTTCDYSVWAHMEDVELVTPAANKGYIAQMAGDRLKHKPISALESKAMSSGPVSSALSKISMSADLLDGVPMLSSFAAPVAWASQIGARIASIFGWSKPTNELVIARRNITTNQYENNCDAIDNVYSLGLMTTNSVSVLPGLGGTDADEMSMSFLNSVNFWFRTDSWLTSDAVGTQIAAIELRPASYAILGTSGLYNFGPLSYFATIFRYYRGSLKFRIKFAKTIFHSGRLALSYSPGYNSDGSTNPLTLDESAYTYREILDMRDACEFEFTIPYASMRPYLLTTQSYGRLSLIVLNPLVAPDTVDTHVDIAWEVSADKDFEFFDPIPPSYVPCTQGAIAQMSSDRVGDIHPHTSGSIGSSTVTGRGTIASELCVGERIMSIKQLLSRACEFQTPVSTACQGVVMRPFDMYNSVVNFPFTGISLNYFDPDYYTTFSSFYKFSRGGVCARFQFETIEIPTMLTFIKFNDDTSVPIISGPSHPTETCRSHITENCSYNGNTLSAKIPMYHPTHCRVNVPYTRTGSLAALTRAVEPYTNSQCVSVASVNSDNAFITGSLLRSAADDFQLGFFLGVPPMASKSSLGH